ncbi:MAG: O-antigen ligase family protein [Agitococcus sp.]|nr:O-antigen ligase family protein [Agitococcus sp.]
MVTQITDIIKKHYEYSFISILLVLPLLAFSGYRTIEMEFTYDEWRTLEVIQLTLLLLSFSINRNIYNYAQTKISPPIFYLFIALVFTSLCSSLISDNHLRALRDNTLIISLFLATIPLAYIFSKVEDTQNKIIFFISLTHIIFLINISAQFLSAYSIQDISVFTSWYNNFNNPRIYGDFLIIFLPLIFLITIKSNKNQKSLMLYTAVSHFLLFFSGGRAEILSLFFSVIMVYLISPSQSTHIKKYFLVISACLLCNFIVQAILPWDFNNFRRNDYSNGRLDIYLKTLQSASTHLIWGTGGDSFYKIPNIKQLVGAHPHNLPLQILSEYGVIVLLIVFLMFSVLFYRWFNKLSQLTKIDNSSVNYIYLSISLLACVINSLFGGNHIYPLSQLYIILVIALIISHHSPYEEKTIPKNIFLCTAIRLSLFIYAGVFAAINYQSLSCYQSRPKTSIIAEDINPRFWSSNHDNFEKSCYNDISK